MKITMTIECGTTDIATLTAMLRLAANSGVSVETAKPEPVAAVTVPAMSTPAVPVAAATQPAPAVQPVATVPAYDTAGIPWDGRIHSGAKSTNADGTWRRRKGITDADVTTVEAELRAMGMTREPVTAAATVPAAPALPIASDVPVPATVAAPPMPSAAALDAAPVAMPVQLPMPTMTAPSAVAMPAMQPVAPVALPTMTAPAPVVQPAMPAPTPVAPSAPVVPFVPPQPPAAPSGAVTFPQLMQHVSSLVGAGKLTVTDLQQMCVHISQRAGKQFNAPTDLIAQPDGIPFAVEYFQQRGLWTAAAA